VLAWQWYMNTSNGTLSDIYYAIRDTDGGVVKPVTQFTFDTPGWDEGYYDPNLARLRGNRVLFVWHRGSDDDIYYAVLNSAGNTVKGATNLSTGTGTGWWNSDAVQLSNGNIVVAWSGSMHFAVLDKDYSRIVGPITLDNPAAVTGDAYVSVAADDAGHAILTWMDADWSYRRNLYYALVDSSGDVPDDLPHQPGNESIYLYQLRRLRQYFLHSYTAFGCGRIGSFRCFSLPWVT